MICEFTLWCALKFLVLQVHGKFLSPLLHRIALPLSDYCLFCIVLCCSQIPRATEHSTGHNGQTQRGAGSWQKEATHSQHTQYMLVHIKYACSYTLASIIHVHTSMDINTHSQLLKGKKPAWQWQAERARLIYKPLWGWRRFTHTHISHIPKAVRDCPQFQDPKLKDIHTRKTNKNDVDMGNKKKRQSDMSDRTMLFLCVDYSQDVWLSCLMGI